MTSGLYSFENLWRQYRACRRNKRNTANALRFEVDAEANLIDLQRELREHTYRPGRSICFVTSGPKPREVFAATFRDRVVHHVLVSCQERVFEPRFIDDSFACRKGKGSLAASDRLMQFLARATANGRRGAWVLKLDVASFFPSIHKETLYRTIARAIHDPEVLWLTRVLLFHDPTTDYHFRSPDGSKAPPGDADYPVPAQKSLFGKRNERALPIGNLTSQFWGNVYLNELDHFVKRELRCRWYLRYVDDIALVSRDREEIQAWRAEIERFLVERLRLSARSGSDEAPAGRGVDFVGWKTWWNRRVPRRGTLGRFRTRIHGFERSSVGPALCARAVSVDLRRRGEIAALGSAIASYAGHLRHGAAWREWMSTWERFPWLAGLFERRDWRVVERWPAPAARQLRFGTSYRRIIRRAAADCLVFFRVGRYVEFYGPQRLLAESVLGLRPVWIPRGGYGLAVGFPVRLARRFVRIAVRSGTAVVLASVVVYPAAPRAAAFRQIVPIPIGW